MGKAPSQTTPVSGSFTVANTAITGTTRMSFDEIQWNSTPCEAISYGEVEDYTVNIVAGAADTTAPAPSSLAASGTTTSTTNLSWSASSDNVAVTGYNVYQGSTLKATVTSTSYVVTGLTANSLHILCKSKDAAGNISATSNAISVTTLNNTLVYCTSKELRS
jgi:hypothetical protein